MKNLKWDLFENFAELNKIKTSTIQENLKNEETKLFLLQDIEMKILADIADKVNNLKNINENYDDVNECVRTDTKYFNYIKRIEMNMFLESKRRTKTKRLENSPEKKERESIGSIGRKSSSTSEYEVEEKELKKENSITGLCVVKTDNSLKDIIPNLTKNPHENLSKKTSRADYSSESIKLAANLQDSNFTEGKVLRSSNNSKSTLHNCYEMYFNSENVMKPLKSYRKKAKKSKVEEDVETEVEIVILCADISEANIIHVKYLYNNLKDKLDFDNP